MADERNVMQWDEDFDVVCVGSGLGGMSAALTAAERGATAIVLEKFHLLGGTCALSSGQLWLGPHHLQSDAVQDSDEDADAYLTHLSQGFATPDRRRVFIERGREALRFMTDVIGIQMAVIDKLPDYYYPAVQGSMPEGRYVEILPFSADRLGNLADKVLTSPYGDGYSYTTSNEFVAMQTGGASVLEALQKHLQTGERCAGAGLAAAQVFAARERGVVMRTSSAVTELVIEDGEVIGVVVNSDDGERRIRARLGVVLATGGYDWKQDFVRAFDALPEAGSMSPPTVTGDHIMMAARAGAIAVPPSQSPIFLGYKVPGEKIYGKDSYRMYLPGVPHSIAVNRHGRRFANDGFYPDVATKVARFDGQEDGQPNWPAWIVFDQSMLDKYGMSPSWAGMKLPDGMAVTADSIAELAQQTGIDAAALADTISRYNGFCIDGVDHDFGRGTIPWGRIMTGDPSLPNPNMAPLTHAPFYAVKIQRVTMGVPTAGLPIDVDGRVLDVSDQPICGLYAAGNSAAWLDIGGGYNSGIANTRGLLYGYLAALDMTSQRKPASERSL
jgi:3-oxosteroid 1-dehydrogenase